MIEIQGLTKRYGSKLAVDRISFSVGKGEIVGFLGPNGAGKSTTMNIITGYLSATEGRVLIDGHEILEEPTEAKKCIGYLPELPPLYPDMTVWEYLNFIYELKKAKTANRAKHLDTVCGMVKISHVKDRLIANLSKGYKQRVGIAQALIGNPEVLILDEPTVGLDPNQIIEIRSLIKSLSRNHTVILSTHILSEVQSVCDRVIIINQGVIVADDTERNLSEKLSKDKRYTLRVKAPQTEALTALSRLEKMESVRPHGQKEQGVYEFLLQPKENQDIREDVFELLRERDWPMLEFKHNAMNLEDIFIRLTDPTVAQAIAKENRKEEQQNAQENTGKFGRFFGSKKEKEEESK